MFTNQANLEETCLQVRLNGVATFIGSIGLAVAAAVLVILLTRYECYLCWLLFWNSAKSCS